jgi:hypothetical protein
LALSSSATRAHSSSSSFHPICLLYISRHFQRLPAAPPAASRHRVGIAIQMTAAPGLNDFAQITGNEGNDLYPVSGKQFVQRPGNRPADQRADFQFREPKRFLNHQLLRQLFLRLAYNSTGSGFHHVNPSRRIKDRRDPFIPIRKGRFHGIISVSYNHDAI